MDDRKYGTEDSRGYWTPRKPLTYPDVFVWPMQLRGILAWLPGYLFPWTLLYAGLTVFVFLFLTPDVARMQEASFGWMGLILLRNYVLHIAVVGVQHYWFYHRQAQGTAFKYNRRWPQPRNPALMSGVVALCQWRRGAARYHLQSDLVCPALAVGAIDP